MGLSINVSSDVNVNFILFFLISRVFLLPFTWRPKINSSKKVESFSGQIRGDHGTGLLFFLSDLSTCLSPATFILPPFFSLKSRLLYSFY